jgi:hypothetical protein
VLQVQNLLRVAAVTSDGKVNDTMVAERGLSSRLVGLELLTPDGLHLSVAGYKTLLECVSRELHRWNHDLA